MGRGQFSIANAGPNTEWLATLRRVHIQAVSGRKARDLQQGRRFKGSPLSGTVRPPGVLIKGDMRAEVVDLGPHKIKRGAGGHQRRAAQLPVPGWRPIHASVDCRVFWR